MRTQCVYAYPKSTKPGGPSRKSGKKVFEVNLEKNYCVINSDTYIHKK